MRISSRLIYALLSTAALGGCLDARKEERADANIQRCTACHGDPSREGDYLQRSAPPIDLMLSSGDPAYPGVGAHAQHVYGSETHVPVACTECHVVPDAVEDPGHADDPYPAEVVFGALSRSGARTPAYNHSNRTCGNTYCHYASAPVWTSPRSSAEACGSCHGLPPPPPHPQSRECVSCHADVVGTDNKILRPDLHVNGTVEYAREQTCTSCHGSENSAPPRALNGATSTRDPGVGAHQAHLAGTTRSRAVPCGECHIVPQNVSDPGHIDSFTPAEVVFSGAANVFGPAVYDNGTCRNTSCHGGSFALGAPSGGTNTEPSWTRVDGSQAQCGACHSLPPPPPHPSANEHPTCSECHPNIAPDNATITLPELHVNGFIEVDNP